jgi:hypothetical protein
MAYTDGSSCATGHGEVRDVHMQFLPKSILPTYLGKRSGGMMSRTPNDDRSDSLNLNNDAFSSSQDNRSDQLNPNNERYQGSDKSDPGNEDD